jgi:hypothetical protein
MSSPRPTPFRAHAASSLVLIGLAACAGAPAPCPDLARSTASPSAALASAEPVEEHADAPALRITLAPSPTPSPHVAVTIELRALPELGAKGWTMSRSAYAALEGPIVVTDSTGSIATRTSEDERGAHVALERAPSGAVKVAYSVRAGAPAFPGPPSVAVDPDRFEGLADALLLLPDALDERAASVRLHVDTANIGSKELVGAASTFGVGPTRTVTARGSELRRAMFVAGILGKAVFDAPEGHDEAAWLGYTAFDPRPASADMAGFRTAVRQLFKTRESSTATMLFLTDGRPVGSFVVTRLPRSVVVRVGAGEPWSGPVRIAAASAVLHEWVGERLWVGPSDAEHEAEAYWFTEGLVRNVARDLLFRFGLVPPAEAAADLEALAAIAATSPLSSLDNAALARRAREPGATPLLVARGALYAARVDALLRKKSGGKRSLEDVLAGLYAKADAARAPLPTAAWIEALRTEVGDAEAAAFTAGIERGAPIDVPDGALGPCFKRVERTYAAFELGFDQAATHQAPDGVVRGLDPKGPAAKAGLLATDALRSVQLTAGRADVPVELLVGRSGAEKTIRYLPRGRTGKGPGWERKKELAEDACAR